MIVVAAGSGSRFGGAKQYAPLLGRRVVDWAIEAARSVGALPILVRTGHGEKTLREWPNVAGLTVFADLAEFARHWITRSTAVAGRRDGA